MIEFIIGFLTGGMMSGSHGSYQSYGGNYGSYGLEPRNYVKSYSNSTGVVTIDCPLCAAKGSTQKRCCVCLGVGVYTTRVSNKDKQYIKERMSRGK